MEPTETARTSLAFRRYLEVAIHNDRSCMREEDGAKEFTRFGQRVLMDDAGVPERTLEP